MIVAETHKTRKGLLVILHIQAYTQLEYARDFGLILHIPKQYRQRTRRLIPQWALRNLPEVCKYMPDLIPVIQQAYHPKKVVDKPM